MSQTKTAKKKAAKKLYGPDVYKRNGHGLLENAEYIFNEDGSVNWRKMVGKHYLVPNKQRTNETDVSSLEDRDLLILLGGIKELAQIRGFINVSYNVVTSIRSEANPTDEQKATLARNERHLALKMQHSEFVDALTSTQKSNIEALKVSL